MKLLLLRLERWWYNRQVERLMRVVDKNQRLLSLYKNMWHGVNRDIIGGI